MSVAAITGGARGIGLAIAKRLAAEGYRIAIGDIDAELAESAAAEIDGAIGLALDVASASAFEEFIAAVEERLGGVDVLVNNAGIMPIGPFEEQDEALAHRVFDINVHGVLNGARAVLPRMLARGSGHIVNIASTAGKAVTPGGVVYGGSKHAVVGISDGLRQEYAARGIKVSAIAPTFTQTELIAGTKGLRGLPNISPEEVADVVAYALKKNAAFEYAPRWLRFSMASRDLLPTSINDRVTRMFGGDTAFLDVDQGARDAYDKRIGGAR